MGTGCTRYLDGTVCRPESGMLPPPKYRSRWDRIWTKFLYRHERLRRLELRCHWWWHFSNRPAWWFWERT